MKMNNINDEEISIELLPSDIVRVINGREIIENIIMNGYWMR